jgi:hypothetical protein
MLKDACVWNERRLIIFTEWDGTRLWFFRRRATP